MTEKFDPNECPDYPLIGTFYYADPDSNTNSCVNLWRVGEKFIVTDTSWFFRNGEPGYDIIELEPEQMRYLLAQAAIHALKI